MTDLWSFLLQTLTASGVAVLLLAVKRMFRDKLSPRWQFRTWGLLALFLILPAGMGGRYVLVDWPRYVEALKSSLTGEYGTLTRVLAPVPLPSFSMPRSVWEWLYAVYVLGTAVLLGRYVLSYVRLRLALRRGRPAEMEPIRAVAEKYGLPVCPAVEVEGLSSAFVCGAFKPVLALPAGVETDEKVLLHELLHLKHRDAVWGLVVGVLRCLHWCDPLLWWCADRAGNDLEALCDQRVLERLEGEERREYGKILLEMADERYARMPGTSSIANGGKNVRRRIEAIARSKRYPKGMGLVSVCLVLVLAAPLLVGARAEKLDRDLPFFDEVDAAMASARTTACTTYAGALDAYAKAVMKGRITYRAMCAPLAEQDGLAEDYRLALAGNARDYKDFLRLDSDVTPDGYGIYNVTQVGEDAYEGILALRLIRAPDGMPDDPYIWMAVQRVRAEKEGERWVAIPQEEFWPVHAAGWQSMPTSCDQLPAREYEAQAGDFRIVLRRQSLSYVDSWTQSAGTFFSSAQFDATPRPGGSMETYYYQVLEAVYTGDPAEKGRYRHIAASSMPLWEGEERPTLTVPGRGTSSGTSSDGECWGGRELSGGWESPVYVSGGGSQVRGEYSSPDRYAVDLYVNGGLAAELTLMPVEGGTDRD